MDPVILKRKISPLRLPRTSAGTSAGNVSQILTSILKDKEIQQAKRYGKVQG